LGAGFDTLYWRLKESGHIFNKFVEFDFSSVTSKKIRLIQRSKNVNLSGYFSNPGKYFFNFFLYLRKSLSR